MPLSSLLVTRWIQWPTWHWLLQDYQRTGSLVWAAHWTAAVSNTELSQHLGCSPADLNAVVVGGHGDTTMIPLIRLCWILVKSSTGAFNGLSETRQPMTFSSSIFPDPTTFGVGKLFQRHFMNESSANCPPMQASSFKLLLRLCRTTVFGLSKKTLASSGFIHYRYAYFLPTFGDWGFVLAKTSRIPRDFALPQSLKLACLNAHPTRELTYFPVGHSERRIYN